MISALRRNWPALMLGLGAALGHAPWSLWVLSIASFILFFLWLARSTGKKLLDFFTSFWVFGTGYFILALSWIVEPFLVDAAAHGWMAPFALCLMASGMALFWALSGVGYVWLGPWGGLAFFVIGEWLRGHVFTGFPWGMPSYVLIETPLWAWFSVLGPYGTTLLLLAVCLAFARALVYTSRREIGIAILVLLISASPKVWRVQSKSEPPLMSVRLVQPNAPQAQKWDPNFAPIFYERLIAATQQKPHPDLIVWPESAITNLLNYAPDMIDEIRRAADGTPVVLGALRFDDQDRLKNSFVLLHGQDQVSVYDKSHLVPFGEYLPFEPLLRPLGLGFFYDLFGGAFSAGDGPELMSLPSGQTMLPLICYELIFPDLVRHTSSRPDVIVQITNDAWFGTWSGPYQHLAQAKARAIENGISVVRVANTGISTVIAPDGTLLKALGLGTQGAIDLAVPVPYKTTLYWRFGDLGVAIILVLMLFAALCGRMRNKMLTSL